VDPENLQAVVYFYNHGTKESKHVVVKEGADTVTDRDRKYRRRNSRDTAVQKVQRT
jgi:hypothetical protein